MVKSTPVKQDEYLPISADGAQLNAVYKNIDGYYYTPVISENGKAKWLNLTTMEVKFWDQKLLRVARKDEFVFVVENE